MICFVYTAVNDRHQWTIRVTRADKASRQRRVDAMVRHEALSADLLLINGRVLTMDAHDGVAQAVAVWNGKIVAVGSSADIEPLAGASTQVIELDGRTAMPGLTDCHVHLASDSSRAVESVECRDLYDANVNSVAAIVSRLQQWATSIPPGQWIIARGSPLADFRLKEGRLPTRAALDAALPRHPTYISFGAHVVIANSLALQERGITRHTPSPQGGTVVKDPLTGEPTGELRERAQFLVKRREGEIDPATLAERIAVELEKCSHRGVTAIHDIIISKEEVQAYQLLARAGRLPVRVQMLMRVIESSFNKQSLLDLGFVHGMGSEWLQIGGIKMSIDGGFTGKNAAFREPIAGDNDHHEGLIRIQQDELEDTVELYHTLGMRICTHAIGDIAMDMILDAYEKALTRHPRQDHRHRVEHLGNWLMTPERVERSKRLGILPIANPPFLFFFGDPMVEMLQRRATEQGFPFRTLWDAGFPLSFGSDAPGYYPVDPLRDLGTAVAHQTLSGQKVTVGEALTMREALRSQTINAAYTAFQEQALGSIEVGKLADIIVLGDDPLTFAPERFWELPVDMTIAGGKIVHTGAVRTPAGVPSAGVGVSCSCVHR
jgi:predicted amidohydrolase YtcJ